MNMQIKETKVKGQNLANKISFTETEWWYNTKMAENMKINGQK